MEIAVVDDNKLLAKSIKKSLELDHFDVEVFFTIEDAEKLIDTPDFPDLFILDYKVGSRNAMEIVDTLIRSGAGVIIITAYGEVDVSIEAFKKGIYDFLIKPLNMDHLLFVVHRFFKEKEKEEILKLQKGEEEKKLIQGKSTSFRDILDNADKVAPTDTTVLILGESGSGKEVIARYIHKKSGRPGHFIPVNCASIPSSLLESELFGYERGAFTGAYKRKKGFIELANEGTLFLDEIGEMPLELQAKLLRVLQDGMIYKLGSESPIKVNFRLICSTNKDLENMVKEEKFREDLFYRISVFPLRIPPLRERPEDIPYLANYYVEYYSIKIKGKKIKISDEAMDKMLNYEWTGNVRELENVIERSVIISNGDIIKEEDISIPSYKEESLEEIGNRAKREAEKIAIKRALVKCNGDKKCAAQLLKVSYKTLLNRLKEMNDEIS